MQRIFITFCLILCPIVSSASLIFEGVLQDVEISELRITSDGAEERIFETKYVLLLSEPLNAVLPNGLFERVFFVLLEMPIEFTTPKVFQKLEFQQSRRPAFESGCKPALTERLPVGRCEGGGFKDWNAGEDENQFLNDFRYKAICVQ